MTLKQSKVTISLSDYVPFFNFWSTQVPLPFCGATDTHFGLLMMFLWVSRPEWSALFTLGRGVCVTCSLIFPSAATPAELLVASIAAELISCTCD